MIKIRHDGAKTRPGKTFSDILKVLVDAKGFDEHDYGWVWTRSAGAGIPGPWTVFQLNPFRGNLRHDISSLQSESRKRGEAKSFKMRSCGFILGSGQAASDLT